MKTLKLTALAILIAGATYAGVMPEVVAEVPITVETTVGATPEAENGLDQLLQFLFS
ncbi:MAG: hypothetical protein HOH05_10025, partial [Marinovum sp.]|nr:hypothetical protein [Marinovum sp.]